MKGKDGVVKIEKKLLKEIEEFVKKNKYFYSSKKQVVNLAIIEFLKSKSFSKKKVKKSKRNQKEAKKK